MPFYSQYYLEAISNAINRVYVDNTLTTRVSFNGLNNFVASSKGFGRNQFDYRDINATIQVGFGYDLTIFQKMTLSIQPTAQYFLVTTTPRQTDYYNRRLFNFGLSIAAKI